MSPIYDPRYSKVRRDEALEKDRETSRSTAQMEYVKPLVLLGLGLPIAATLAVRGAGAPPDVGTASVLGSYLLQFGLSVVLGLAALLIATKLMAGGPGPLALAVLRLGGALAVFDVTYLLLGGNLQITIFPGLVSIFILTGLIVWLFDMDLFQGALVGIVICVAKLAVAISTFFWFFEGPI